MFMSLLQYEYVFFDCKKLDVSDFLRNIADAFKKDRNNETYFCSNIVHDIVHDSQRAEEDGRFHHCHA